MKYQHINNGTWKQSAGIEIENNIPFQYKKTTEQVLRLF